MIRTLIVDDEPLPRERIRTLLTDRPEIEIVGECGDGREALAAIQKERPDLVFLDIQMPELDGFGVIRSLEEDRLPMIIFVTAYDEYAVDAFEVNALDYILKPIHPARFEKALLRAINRLDRDRKKAMNQKLHAFAAQWQRERSYTRRFAVRRGAKLYFVRTEDVDWIEAAANYAQLHVGNRTHLVRETMKSLEAQLDPDAFVRVHRSVIINLDRIRSIEPHGHGEYLIIMQDGTRLTSSRSYSERLRARIRGEGLGGARG